MGKIVILLVVVLLFLGTASVAVSANDLTIVDTSITTQISDRLPVDSLNTVSADVDKLYCYTRITGAVEDTWITHVWYYEDQELARVRLPINSSNWRTWSSKKVLPQWRGTWRVEILDATGQPILLVPFSVI